MKLESLRDFEWFNDPYDVSFDEEGMRVLSFEKTDFWQSKHRKVHKDNGHFFFIRKSGNFSFDVHWRFLPMDQFAQCGLMLRIDENNWIKISQVGSFVTNNGYSDWANFDLPKGTEEAWYRVKRNGADYILFYSLDGKIFKQTRLLHLSNDMSMIKVGAYICSPGDNYFEATLVDMG